MLRVRLLQAVVTSSHAKILLILLTNNDHMDKVTRCAKFIDIYLSGKLRIVH